MSMMIIVEPRKVYLTINPVASHSEAALQNLWFLLDEEAQTLSGVKVVELRPPREEKAFFPALYVSCPLATVISKNAKKNAV